MSRSRCAWQPNWWRRTSENLSTNRASQSFLRIAENFPAWMHTDEWQSYGPHESKCLASRNSFSWRILRVSHLLRGFYSAHHDLTLISRGFYAQNMGGGILSPYAPVCLSLGTPEAAPMQNC
jgi:hypothetical protein